jgi:hypothetical protein
MVCHRHSGEGLERNAIPRHTHKDTKLVFGLKGFSENFQLSDNAAVSKKNNCGGVEKLSGGASRINPKQDHISLVQSSNREFLERAFQF